MKKITLTILILSILSLLIVPLSFAGDMAQDPTTMTEEQKAIMANMQDYSTPNENHTLLATLAGNWDAEVSHWMDPKGEAMNSPSTATATIIHGGRFLEQKFSGTFQGQPYEGRGVMGYDNIQKVFQEIWFDNFGTGIMTSSGTYNAETKTITEEGMMSCPITNTARWHRSVTTLVDTDHYTYEIFMKDVQSGEEYRSMLIKYSRQVKQE
jgi:hypothetical protein